MAIEVEVLNSSFFFGIDVPCVKDRVGHATTGLLGSAHIHTYLFSYYYTVFMPTYPSDLLCNLFDSAYIIRSSNSERIPMKPQVKILPYYFRFGWKGA